MSKMPDMDAFGPSPTPKPAPSTSSTSRTSDPFADLGPLGGGSTIQGGGSKAGPLQGGAASKDSLGSGGGGGLLGMGGAGGSVGSGGDNGTKKAPAEGAAADADTRLFNNLRPMIQVIDDLRDVGLQQYIDLPRIVAIGSQSSGKSSVIGRISSSWRG